MIQLLEGNAVVTVVTVTVPRVQNDDGPIGQPEKLVTLSTQVTFEADIQVSRLLESIIVTSSVNINFTGTAAW
eukprot:g33937.t1